jgi:hypothetical protein
LKIKGLRFVLVILSPRQNLCFVGVRLAEIAIYSGFSANNAFISIAAAQLIFALS